MTVPYRVNYIFQNLAVDVPHKSTFIWLHGHFLLGQGPSKLWADCITILTRLGIGPSSQLAFAVGGSRVAVTSAVASDKDKASSDRAYWKSLLQLHQKYSCQDSREESRSQAMPWALHCSRTEELSYLCKAFAAIHEERCVSCSNRC